jgi:hypothetical protein
MRSNHPALNERQLAFRKFALRDLSRPAVLSKDLSQDPAQDFLALSLGSFERHLELAEGMHRQSGERIALQAGYLDCARPDARSAERDGVHLIALHVGLGAAAFEFSLFCLSQSTVLRQFGDPLVERNPKAPDGYPPGFWMRESGAVLGRDAFLQTALSMIPQHPRRYEVAVFLTALMMRFVWFHELYHAVNGHVGLVDEYGFSLGFGETDNTAPSIVGGKILNLLELDADQSALHALCNVAIADIENIEGLRHLSHDEHVLLSLFAAYASTWMLDEYLLRGNGGASGAHPAPAIRRQNLIRSHASTLAPRLANAKHNHDAVLSEMTALSDIIPRFPSGHQLRSEMQDSVLQADLDSAQIALEHLRGDLTPFRFS